MTRFHFWMFAFLVLFAVGWVGSDAVAAGGGKEAYPMSLLSYEASEQQLQAELGHTLTLWETLGVRVKADPFNLIATIIFGCAVIHTLLASVFNKIAYRFDREHEQRIKASGIVYEPGREPVSFRATLFHFLGEVEAVFGIWVVPLLACLFFVHGWDTMLGYMDSRVFVEPVFVVVIMAIAATRPVVLFARNMLARVAGIGGHTPAAWWLTILTIAPLLGSLITEPAAMTIAAMLLGIQFYRFNPSMKFRYATLGLLFVNISVGGTLTHFAAPPVLMVSNSWGWDLPFMFTNFGSRAILGIVIANLIYYFIFRKELSSLKDRVATQAATDAEEDGDGDEKVPVWITTTHLFFVAWTVFTLHHPPLFIGGFLFFLAFTMATRQHQFDLSLKGPILVGFFLAGLIVHGGLQAWWIAPVLSSLGHTALFVGAGVLSAFNDNAAITYLASQVPAFSQLTPDLLPKTGEALTSAKLLQYLVVAGAISGGGLTVIANAPNPAGQSILSKYFKGGVSPLYLLLAALLPTIIMALTFLLLVPSF